MKILISESQCGKLLMEYEVLPYKRTYEQPGRVDITFKASGLKYEASIWHKDEMHNIGEYELAFNAWHQSHVGERTKKDISHLYNVIYTVIDFAEKVVKEKKIKVLKIEGANDEQDTNTFLEPTLRAKLYYRIISNRYPKDAIHFGARWIRIDMTKVFPEVFVNQEQTNMEKLLDLLDNISDEADSRERIKRGFRGSDLNNVFSFNGDIENFDYGYISMDIRVHVPMKEVSLEMTFHDENKTESYDFRSFEELYDYLDNRFNF